MSNLLQISNLTVKRANIAVLKDFSWTINTNENYLLGGKSGSGKTTLAHAIIGKLKGNTAININYDSASKLPAKTHYIANWYQFTNLEGDRNFYYQQRYNYHQGKDTVTVGADLTDYAKKENLDLDAIQNKIQSFGFDHVLDSQLIELSSGEHKKLQLLKGLWLKPQLLIIDEPYTGLDKKSREVLNQWLDELTSQGVRFILICNDHNIPKSVNKFVQIIDGQLHHVNHHQDLIKNISKPWKEIPAFLKEAPQSGIRTMVKLKNITIRYGDKEVLKNVSWEVKKSDKWLIYGPNGSGKSTLLSLINGDHPQSYGLDIELFDKKRGSGESIWNIKEKIGMVSPEIHWYFDQNATVWHTIASGFYDSIGWFVDVKFSEKQQIDELLAYFELTEHKNQLLHTLPLGQQRLTMLARSLIKNPPLLVLDEPCQGLDIEQTKNFNQVIDALCQYGKTLIYVGHYESQLPACIEKRLILKKGEVVAIENKTENVL